jgi:large subunit ribosomal protein L25
MAKSTISLEKRESLKHKNRQIRREGIVPAVIYGPNRKSTNVQVPTREATDLLKAITPSSVITAKLGAEDINVFVSEVQTNPRNNQLTHVSFFEPDPIKKIIVHIPLEPIGISPAVKNNLGILFFPIDAIPVRGLPKDAVERLEIDVAGLEKIGDSIKLEDIKLPAGLELAHVEEDGHKTAVTITPFQKEIVEEVVVAPVEGEEGAEGEAAVEGEVKEGETPAEGEAPKTEEAK